MCFKLIPIWCKRKEEERRVDKNIWSSFLLLFHIFQLSNIPLSEKRQRRSREQERDDQKGQSKSQSPFCALLQTFICPCSILSWTGPNSATVYLESFFILWSSAAKFSSTATRFSFIVCWTWGGRRKKRNQVRGPKHNGKKRCLQKEMGRESMNWWVKQQKILFW